MSISPNKFPPKFSQNILYPATYNLDEMDMPQSNDSLGTYFDVTFPNYGINGTPTLTYGKHAVNITLTDVQTEYSSQGYELGGLPKLKSGTTILFEAKDKNGNVIFSDSTPIRSINGFTAYIWLKQDPLRTYDNIVDGYGKFRIVAKAHNTNPNWRNRYNVRTEMDIWVSLGDLSGGYYINESPIIFQNPTGSIGSGSGLTVSEVLEETNAGSNKYISYLNVSASKLRTFSGKINSINTYMKVSSSSGLVPEWDFLNNHPLTSSHYEDDIYKTYGQGINTLSEQWNKELTVDTIQHLEDPNKVKFKFEFINPLGQTAKDIYGEGDESNDYILQYPNLPDNDPNGWIQFIGGDVIESEVSAEPTSGTGWNSGAGQFDLHYEQNSGVHHSGAQSFDSDGNLVSFNGGGNCQFPPCDGGSGPPVG